MGQVDLKVTKAYPFPASLLQVLESLLASGVEIAEVRNLCSVQGPNAKAFLFPVSEGRKFELIEDYPKREHYSYFGTWWRLPSENPPPGYQNTQKERVSCNQLSNLYRILNQAVRVIEATEGFSVECFLWTPGENHYNKASCIVFYNGNAVFILGQSFDLQGTYEAQVWQVE